MDAHQDRIVRADIAHHHGQMHVAIDGVFESYCAETSIDCRQIGFHGAPHQNFFLNAITHQISDADNLQAMNHGEVFELWQPCHGAVFVHDFADDSRRIKSRDTRYIDGRFRLAGPHQHAALLRAQRKDVSRSGEVMRLRSRIDRRQNRRGPISG